MNCKFCSKETHNPSYCSNSCAAKYNNRENPKRKLSRQCKKCNCPITKDRVYCKDCWNGTDKPIYIKILEDEQRCLGCNIVSDSNNSYIKRDRYSSYCKVCSIQQKKATKLSLKQFCINYKGGKCQNCGYCKNTSALAFHHLDPLTKDFNISEVNGTMFSLKLQQELDKTILVCFNCHQEIHNPDSAI